MTTGIHRRHRGPPSFREIPTEERLRTIAVEQAAGELLESLSTWSRITTAISRSSASTSDPRGRLRQCGEEVAPAFCAHALEYLAPRLQQPRSTETWSARARQALDQALGAACDGEWPFATDRLLDALQEQSSVAAPPR